MAGRTSVAWGSDLKQGVARFAAWRRGREVGARIPAALWELAVKLAEDVERIRAVFESYAYVSQLIDQKNQTLARLRKK